MLRLGLHSARAELSAALAREHARKNTSRKRGVRYCPLWRGGAYADHLGLRFSFSTGHNFGISPSLRSNGGIITLRLPDFRLCKSAHYEI